jgi:hypothetical protein
MLTNKGILYKTVKGCQPAPRVTVRAAAIVKIKEQDARHIVQGLV